ncbi:MAG TPA: YhjD/YihY/BrkB family envelope integrity protein [Spirochaetia bacterium]|nr:YhjD/YihY/BrkB family envelope integrity protein [Spirochaetia bacterium]
MKAPRLQSAAQRMLFAAERYRDHELANHAAAGAYSFLLSVTPAILLALSFTSTVFGSNPAVVTEINRLVARFLGPLSSTVSPGTYFGHRLSILAAIIGVVSLVWAARLFAVTVQRGIRIIWATTARKSLARENAVSLVVELVTFAAMVALIAADEGAHVAARAVRGAAGVGTARTIIDIERLAPVAALFLFTGWGYMVLPAKRPSPRAAWGSAALCFVSFLAVTGVFRLFIGAAHYELLYGVLGNLILLLVNVFAFFSLYFYFAELVYVSDQFDALLFGRFHRLTRARTAGSEIPRLERALFVEPARLLHSYGRNLRKGELLFSAGDTGKSAYFVYYGRVGIYIRSAGGDGAESAVASLGPGEVFGEMAHILGEERTATARADEDSAVLELPPGVFEQYLASHPDASRNLISALSERLKSTDTRIRG